MEIKDIKETVDLLGKTVGDKVDAATKSINDNVDAKLAEAEKEISEKAAKIVKDEMDKFNTEQEIKEAKRQTSYGKENQKSFGEVLKAEMEAKTDDLNKFIRKETKSVSIELKAVGDVSIANVTGGSRYGQVMGPGIIEQPKRKVHMRQILPGGSIGPGNTFTFMRQDGQGEGDIAPVAEGALKPQFDLDLIEATVNIETIAGWMRVTRKAMNNIPGFTSFLQSRLPEKLMKVEDAQALYGSGVTPNIKGILTTGNFVQSTSAATNLAEKIIDDIALLEDTHERTATAILLRPVDYFGFFKQKAAGSGEYDLPQNVVFVNGQLYISGIPVYATTALGQTDVDPGVPVVLKNDYVVGDFQMGAQWLTQEGMRIEFFEQDGTNVRENKVTVRIEETVAMPVYGPNYFVKGNVS